jgi:hypothetical protein
VRPLAPLVALLLAACPTPNQDAWQGRPAQIDDLIGRVDALELENAAQAEAITTLTAAVDGALARLDDAQTGLDLATELAAVVDLDAESAVLTISGVDVLITTGEVADAGNLIVGPQLPATLDGTHNVVVGEGHSIEGDTSLVVGQGHVIKGNLNFAAGVSGAIEANGAATIGGDNADVSGDGAVVIGGRSGEATGANSVVVGGEGNAADGARAVALGGTSNVAGSESSEDAVALGHNTNAAGQNGCIQLNMNGAPCTLVNQIKLPSAPP